MIGLVVSTVAATGGLALPALAATPAVAAGPAATSAAHQFSSTAKAVGSQKTVAGRAAALEKVFASQAAALHANTATGAAAQAPFALATAYGAPTLWNAGDTGQGVSVALLDSYGDPDIASVVADFDQAEGLPPADVSQISPAGAVPTCASLQATDPKSAQDCGSWAGETDLDVVSVHMMAPSAKIIIAATPVDETEGMTGMPEMMTAMDYIRAHKLASVISMSFGATENTFPSFASITQMLDPTLKRAVNAGITLVTGSGDTGPTDYELDGTSYYPYRTVSWPASSPYVTTVGGSVFNTGSAAATPASRAQNPDTLWNDFLPFATNNVTGAGLSQVYARPSWQNGVKKLTGSSMRSLPDLTMFGEDGTSEASPLFAGTLALAVEANHGHGLGNINPTLYSKVGPAGASDGIVSLGVSNNNLNPAVSAVPGFTAGPGFTIAAGWGTISDVSTFSPALVRALR
jgi:subtilase family serine protease